MGITLVSLACTTNDYDDPGHVGPTKQYLWFTDIDYLYDLPFIPSNLQYTSTCLLDHDLYTSQLYLYSST